MISIRRFAETDHDAVVDLIQEIMGKEFAQDAHAYPTADLDTITETYGGLGEAFFVAVDGKKVVGTVGIKKEDDRIAFLRRLFVSADYRGQKLGTQLIQRAMHFCEEVGYDEFVFRTTSRMTKAIDLCKKNGFIQRAKIQLGPIELFKFVRALHPLNKK